MAQHGRCTPCDTEDFEVCEQNTGVLLTFVGKKDVKCVLITWCQENRFFPSSVD